MKGYVRLKDPDEEVFLDDGAGYTFMNNQTQLRAWDRDQTILFDASRLVTLRLGTGKRPDGFEPVASPAEELT